MLCLRRMIPILMASLVGVPATDAQSLPMPTKPRVELRWVESQRIDGLTEDKGIQSSCDPKSRVYPHANPALVLTSAEVASASLKHYDFSRSGSSSENYMVTLGLTKAAREKLAASVKGDETRLLTILIDGKYWGLRRYEKDPDKPFVPIQAQAETFVPEVGFFSSRAEAQRLVDAFQ